MRWPQLSPPAPAAAAECIQTLHLTTGNWRSILQLVECRLPGGEAALSHLAQLQVAGVGAPQWLCSCAPLTALTHLWLRLGMGAEDRQLLWKDSLAGLSELPKLKELCFVLTTQPGATASRVPYVVVHLPALPISLVGLELSFEGTDLCLDNLAALSNLAKLWVWCDAIVTQAESDASIRSQVDRVTLGPAGDGDPLLGTWRDQWYQYDFEFVSTVAELRALTFLDLAIDQEIFGLGLPHVPKLKRLHLGEHSGLAAGGAAMLDESFERLGGVTELVLENRFDRGRPGFLHLLPGMQQLSCLRRLNLENTGITQLPAGPYLRSLEWLSLPRCLAPIPASLSLATALTVLSLSSNCLDGQGIAFLASLPDLWCITLGHVSDLEPWAGQTPEEVLDMYYATMMDDAAFLRRLIQLRVCLPSLPPDNIFLSSVRDEYRMARSLVEHFEYL